MSALREWGIVCVLGYEAAEIEHYIFLATLDMVTSEECRELDMQRFPVAEAEAGTNLPPMHPHCRSTTMPDMTDEELGKIQRFARDASGNPITVPGNMNYREWYAKYIGDTQGANTGMQRNTKNRGAFAVLPERMTKKHIRQIASDYGISLRGITIVIDADPEKLSPSFGFAGRADTQTVGRIDFFPRAFSSREELTRTLFHEKMHVDQMR